MPLRFDALSSRESINSFAEIQLLKLLPLAERNARNLRRQQVGLAAPLQKGSGEDGAAPLKVRAGERTETREQSAARMQALVVWKAKHLKKENKHIDSLNKAYLYELWV